GNRRWVDQPEVIAPACGRLALDLGGKRLEVAYLTGLDPREEPLNERRDRIGGPGALRLQAFADVDQEPQSPHGLITGRNAAAPGRLSKRLDREPGGRQAAGGCEVRGLALHHDTPDGSWRRRAAGEAGMGRGAAAAGSEARQRFDSSIASARARDDSA